MEQSFDAINDTLKWGFPMQQYDKSNLKKEESVNKGGTKKKFTIESVACFVREDKAFPKKCRPKKLAPSILKLV